MFRAAPRATGSATRPGSDGHQGRRRSKTTIQSMLVPDSRNTLAASDRRSRPASTPMEAAPTTNVTKASRSRNGIVDQGPMSVVNRIRGMLMSLAGWSGGRCPAIERARVETPRSPGAVVGPWCTDFLVGHDPRSSDPNAPRVPAMTRRRGRLDRLAHRRLADADCAARTSGPYRGSRAVRVRRRGPRPSARPPSATPGPLALTVRRLPRTIPPTEQVGCERDEYPSRHRHRDPAAGGSRDGDDGEWTREPPDRTRTTDADAGSGPASRLRRRAPAIQGSADRTPSRTAARGPSVTEVRPFEAAELGWHRGWSDRPFVPAGDDQVGFVFLEVLGAMSTQQPAQPRRGQAARRGRGHDPPARLARRRPRDPDRRVPAPRRRRRRPPTCSSPSRAASASAATRFLGIGPRRLLEVRGGDRPDPGSPGRRRRVRAGPAGDRAPGRRPARRAPRDFVPRRTRRADRGHAALHRRRGRRARLRRDLDRSSRPCRSRPRTRSACRWRASSRPTSSWSSTT